MVAQSCSCPSSRFTRILRPAPPRQATYVPRVGGDWKGRAWGLSSTKIGGKQARDATRVAAGKRGELFYGQKRGFSTDAPPEDPVSYLNRGRGAKEGRARDEDLLKKVRSPTFHALPRNPSTHLLPCRSFRITVLPDPPYACFWPHIH
jgi:hypothetical protein